MTKEIKILINYLLYILSFIFICLIGLTNVFADTYTVIGDQANITVVLVSTAYGSQPFNVPKNSGYNFNQVLEIDYLINNYQFDANKHYQLESHLSEQTLTNANYYNVTGANGEQCLVSYENSVFTGSYPRWDFQCPTATTSITLTISNSSHQYLWSNSGIFNWQSALLKYSTTPISSSDDDTQDIINNNNQNTQVIINNQDLNTQKLIDELNKNNTTCGFNYKQEFNYDKMSNVGVKISDGSIVPNQYFRYSEPTIIFGGYSYDISGFGSGSVNYYTILLYDENMNYIRTIDYRNTTTLDLSSYNGLMYIVTNVNNNNNNKIIIVSKDNICVPSTYSQYYQQNQLNNSINNLDDTLKDDTVDENGVADAFEDFNDYLDDNSTITQLITLPVTLYTAILNNLNGTCQPFNLGKLYGEDLILPCINISQYLGNTLWSMIDIIISGFAVYAIAKKMIKVFNNFSSLKEGDVIDD